MQLCIRFDKEIKEFIKNAIMLKFLKMCSIKTKNTSVEYKTVTDISL